MSPLRRIGQAFFWSVHFDESGPRARTSARRLPGLKTLRGSAGVLRDPDGMQQGSRPHPLGSLRSNRPHIAHYDGLHLSLLVEYGQIQYLQHQPTDHTKTVVVRLGGTMPYSPLLISQEAGNEALPDRRIYIKDEKCLYIRNLLDF